MRHTAMVSHSSSHLFFFLLVANEETEAQRREATCPKPQMSARGETEINAAAVGGSSGDR